MLVEAQIRTAEKFDFDHVSCISDPAREAAGLRGRDPLFRNQPPAVDETNRVLADKGVLRRLKVPDPCRAGGCTTASKRARPVPPARGRREVDRGLDRRRLPRRPTCAASTA